MKRTPLDERPDWLPDDWHMLFRPRKDGKTDRYFMSPSTGHKCFSKSQVMDRIAIEMDDEDDTQIVEQPDGQPTRTRSGRTIRRPTKDIRRRHQPTVEIGDSPEWLPSGWILEIRTSQGPGGMKYKRYVDTSTDSSFSSKKAVLRYLQSEGLGSLSLIKERSTSTNSVADINTSSNQSGSIDSEPANNANPWAKSFETNGCPEYSRLCTIFSDTGKGGQSASGVLSNDVDSTPDHDDSSSETEFSPSPSAQSTQTRPSAGRRRKSRSLLDLTMVDSASKVSKKTPEASPSTSNQFTPIAGRRRKSGSMVASVPEAVLEDVPGFTKVAKTTTTASPSTSTPTSSNPFSMTNCMLELKKIEDIPMPVQLKAISALTVEVWREAFMNMDEGLKKAWLTSLEPDLRPSKTGLVCHDDGICTPSPTKVVFNETEYPSPGATLDLLNDSQDHKRGRGRKNTATEEQVDSPKQASTTQSHPGKTMSSKANTIAVAVRSSERLSGIKANEQVDTPKQGGAITSSEQQAWTKADHVDDSEISELPCRTTDGKQEQLSVEGSGELSSGENQKQGSAAKFLPRRTKSFKASTSPARSSKRLVEIKAVHDIEITDRPRETVVCNSEQLPVLGSGQRFGKSDEPEAVPTVDIDYFLGKIETEKPLPPVAGEMKLSCDLPGFSLTPPSPKLLVAISDTMVGKSEQLPLASELGSLQRCEKSDDREAASAVDIGFIEKLEAEKLPVIGETQLNGGGLVDMEAVHAVDSGICVDMEVVHAVDSGICDRPAETMVSMPVDSGIHDQPTETVIGMSDEPRWPKTDHAVDSQNSDRPAARICDRPTETMVSMPIDYGIHDQSTETMVSMSDEPRCSKTGHAVDSWFSDQPAETMVSISIDSGITNRSAQTVVCDRPAETVVSMSVDSGITDRPAETVVSMSGELWWPKTGHAVCTQASDRPAETMTSMAVSGITDRPIETVVSTTDQPLPPNTVHAVNSFISDRPAETVVSTIDQPEFPNTVHTVNSFISDRSAETMVSMSINSVIGDWPAETMVGMSDESCGQSDKPEAATSEVEERKLSIDSHDTNKPFGASWSDPCIEFAFKTLTTDIIAVDDVSPETPRQDGVSPEMLCAVSFSPKEISVPEEVATIWGAVCSVEGKGTRNEQIPELGDGSCK